eukprot:7988037-Lingulodinium_polyedra.AAC.1
MPLLPNDFYYMTERVTGELDPDNMPKGHWAAFVVERRGDGRVTTPKAEGPVVASPSPSLAGRG